MVDWLWFIELKAGCQDLNNKIFDDQTSLFAPFNSVLNGGAGPF
jgi:hypothetical protein